MYSPEDIKKYIVKNMKNTLKDKELIFLLNKKLIKWSKENNKVTISWSEIQKLLSEDDYLKLVKNINKSVEDNVLKPVGKNKNGRKPALNEKYKIILEEEDYTEYMTEIDFILNPKFKKSYYRKNIKNYIENRDYILKLNNFINNKEDLLDIRISINERSFEIFGEEKFMKKSQFSTIIKNLGLEKEFFNFYETTEPIAYYSVNKKVPQNILIVENKDTFYTMRKYMKEVSSSLLGLDISTIIYGAGKGRIPSLKEFKEYTEDYISDENNKFYYFGDIDYEGIVIFESYNSINASETHLNPFITAYEYIVDKVIDDIEKLPKTKDNQNENIKNVFLDNFNDLYKNRMLEILKQRKYIPQEALNYGDLINFNKRRR